ncbi:MAG: carboxypeptidase-like regulatory domain-containing protein [Candidatus Eremiobacteraeota bacterium]|nr:carboxypeptidase-like regulatory domain-containing protein [Candidatus Eremiobacteraeota bacterium]
MQRTLVIAFLVLTAIGSSCSPPPNVVGVQSYGTVVGRVLDATTNLPIPEALVSVGSLYTATADKEGGFVLTGVPIGNQVVQVHAPGYTFVSKRIFVLQNKTANARYLRLVPAALPAGEATLPPPGTPSPSPSPEPSTSASPEPSASPSPTVSASPSP